MKNLQTIVQLFNKKIFRVPDYQRGYSWGNEQFSELWEDIVNSSSGIDHYMGILYLREAKDINGENWKDVIEINKKLPTNNKDKYKFYNIVDGQQRLTTIVILINELIAFFRREGKKNLAELIEEIYIYPPELKSGMGYKSYRFGYEIDNPSYRYFKFRILEKNLSEDIEETFYTKNLKDAKEFFRAKIAEQYKVTGILGLERIYKIMATNLKFIVYDIEDDFNVNVAFETMNNRGKKLSYLELLKNRLIYLTTLFKADKNDKDRLRKEINEVWKKIYEYLGKNKEKCLGDDDFLRDHWITYFGYSRNEKENYYNFLLRKYFIQNRIKNTEKDIKNELIIESDIDVNKNEEENDNYDEDEEASDLKENLGKLKIEDIQNYIRSLKEIIPFWYLTYYPEESKTINMELAPGIIDWLQKLKRLQPGYFRPLICIILLKNNIPVEKKIEALKAIERWIFIYFRLGTYFQTYRNSFFYNIAKDLYHDKTNIENVLIELSKLTPIENGIISTDHVLARVKILGDSKGFYSWSAIRYFLYEYELYLKGDDKTDIKLTPEAIFTKSDEKDNISIEHIYPQTANNEYWQRQFRKETEETKAILLNSLGNLLPLSQSINSSFQNDSFPEKKNGTKNREHLPEKKSKIKERVRGYYNGCYSEMEVARNKVWNRRKIEERGLKMLDFMEKRWGFKFENKRDKKRILYFGRDKS